MRRVVAFCMLFLISFSLFSCNGDGNATDVTNDAENSTALSTTTGNADADETPNFDTEVGQTYLPITFPGVRKLSDYNGINGTPSHLTWEQIDAFPIKTSDMTIEERRQLCLDFFKLPISFLLPAHLFPLFAVHWYQSGTDCQRSQIYRFCRLSPPR